VGGDPVNRIDPSGLITPGQMNSHHMGPGSNWLNQDPAHTRQHAIADGAAAAAVMALWGGAAIVEGGILAGLAARIVTSPLLAKLGLGGVQLSGTLRCGSKYADRPYYAAPNLLAREIVRTGLPVRDPQAARGAWQWVTPATYNGSRHVMELVMNPYTGTIIHWVTKSAK
jgi:hypothetical protein